MILTPHAIIGSAVSNMLPIYPELGFVLAFLSHYVIDSIPHNHYAHDSFILKETKSIASLIHNIRGLYQFSIIIFDFLIGLFLSILIFSRDWDTLLITLLGVAGGVLPDFLQFLYFKFKKWPFISLQKFHGKFECKKNIEHKPFLGASIQITTIIFFIFVSFLVSN
ncbi:MAG: hypothetical protein NTU76_00670 [Candidatus Taylorbacteria bacterium]|nr:hypothetical protein [Candidatus Taylorbacteria bacterium]